MTEYKVEVLIAKEIYDKLQDMCDEQGKSASEIIERLIEAAAAD